MRAPAPRGQSTVEIALGLLVMIPIILGGLFLAETSIFRLKATEAATEPLWDSTAYRQQAYTGAFNRMPSAAAAATAQANSRAKERSMVFTRATAPKSACTMGGGLGLTIGSTAGVYSDNGGISCVSSMTVDPKGITRFFLDTGKGSFFQVPLNNMLRQFQFCQTEKCRPFVMAVADWGLTRDGFEAEECALTSSGCANRGFFDFSKRTYEAHRTGDGTRNRAFRSLVQGVVVELPANLDAVTDFQMSFRGEESTFTQTVPVSEGEPDWHTTPTFGAWGTSYGERASRFLGL